MKQTLLIVGTPPGRLDVKIVLEADFEQQAPAMEALAHYLDGEQVELVASYADGKVTIEFVAEHPVHSDYVAQQAESAATHAVERDAIAVGEVAPNRAGQYDGPPPDHVLAAKQPPQMLVGAPPALFGGQAAEAAIAANHEPPAKEPSAADLDAAAKEQKTETVN